MAFGVAMERYVYRPIQRHEGSFFTVFVAAFGVGIVVQNVIGMIAGRGFATVDTPLSFSAEILPDVFVAPMLWIALATRGGAVRRAHAVPHAPSGRRRRCARWRRTRT